MPIIRRRLLLAAIAIAAIPAAPARAEFIVAPDVVVHCEPTLRPALAAIAAAWRRQTGVPVDLFAAPTASILEQVGHRVRADLIIGEGKAAAADAARRHIIDPPTLVTLWRNRLVAAARASAPPGSSDALATRIGVGPIAIVDPLIGSAGIDTRQALSAAGLWPAIEAHRIGVVGTADASFLLTGGRVEHAVLYASDVAADPGLVVVAPLPDAYPPIVYWVAETHNKLSPKTVDFAQFLREPPAQERAHSAGLEILR